MRKSKAKIVSSKQARILKLLYDFKCLDTAAINLGVDRGHSLQATINTLNQLKDMRLVMCHRHPPGPALYNLTAAGARAIGQEVKNQHRRRPGKPVLEQRRLQIRVEDIAGRRGMIIYRATPASPFSRVKAHQSEVRQALIEHYLLVEKARLEKPEATRQLDYHTRRINLQAGITPVSPIFRDYYLHYPNRPGIIVILPGMTADRHFWLKKIDDLRRLGGYIPVICLFQEKPGTGLINELKQAGFLPVLIEKFEALLGKLLPANRSEPGLVTSSSN